VNAEHPIGTSSSLRIYGEGDRSFFADDVSVGYVHKGDVRIAGQVAGDVVRIARAIANARSDGWRAHAARPSEAACVHPILNDADATCGALLAAVTARKVECERERNHDGHHESGGYRWPQSALSKQEQRATMTEPDTNDAPSDEKQPAIIRHDGERIHFLKTWPFPFEDMKAGRKPFEYRRWDRDFRVNDILVLEKWSADGEKRLDGTEHRRVTYLLPGGSFGVPNGYCVMGLVRVDDPRVDNPNVEDDEYVERCLAAWLGRRYQGPNELRLLLRQVHDDGKFSAARTDYPKAGGK
jgi:hypothetical protein